MPDAEGTLQGDAATVSAEATVTVSGTGALQAGTAVLSGQVEHITMFKGKIKLSIQQGRKTYGENTWKVPLVL